MTTLEWLEADGAYVCDGYRITRSSDHEWMLTLDASRIRSVVRRGRHRSQRFGSLRSARAAALHLEVVTVRRMKRIRHVTLAFVLAFVSVASYLTMAASTPARQLEWFVVSGIALVFAFNEGLGALVLTVSDGWDHKYEVPRVTLVDRIVAGLVTRTLLPRADAAARPPPPPVRVIPLG